MQVSDLNTTVRALGRRRSRDVELGGRRCPVGGRLRGDIDIGTYGPVVYGRARRRLRRHVGLTRAAEVFRFVEPHTERAIVRQGVPW